MSTDTRNKRQPLCDHRLNYAAGQPEGFLRREHPVAFRYRARVPELVEFVNIALETAARFATATRRHVEQVRAWLEAPFGADFPLSRITPQRATGFWSGLQRVREGFQDKPMRVATRNWILRYVKTMFKHAVRWEHIPKNPFDSIRAVRDGRTTRRPWHYVRPEEYRKLLKVAPTLRWKVFYALAYTSGARFGELFNLRESDFDFERGVVLGSV